MAPRKKKTATAEVVPLRGVSPEAPEVEPVPPQGGSGVSPQAMPDSVRETPRRKRARPDEVEVPNMIEVSAVAMTEASEARQALDYVRASVLVEAQDALRQAVKMIAEMKDARDAVDTKRRSFIDPLRKSIAAIDDFFGPAIESLEECERILKERIDAFVQRQGAERDRMLLEAGDAARDGNREMAAALVMTADARIVEKVPGLAIRETWDGEVVDAAALPREYLVPDMKALRARTQSTKGDPQIPGWRAFVKRVVAITRKEAAGDE